MSVATGLPGRAVLRVSGDDRLHFLEGLLTVSLEDAPAGSLLYGALLTPQGKIVTDMMILPDEESVALDVPEAAAADLSRRLTMYKLRAAVMLTPSDEVPAVATDEAALPGARPDPRHPHLGVRALLPPPGPQSEEAAGAYTRARIAAGVPDGGLDFALGETFPHDANMDVTGGVDFAKGCFVGQEVVSRMRHRGTARRRTVIVSGKGELPASGSAISVDGRAIGTLGSSLGSDGLAIVRIDRTDGEALAGDVPVRLAVPDGAPFSFAQSETPA